MSKVEKRYLRSFLEAFHVKGENTAIKLLTIMERHPELGQDELSLKLYGDPRSKAFLMLKGRLFERMMEVLSLSINLENNPVVRDDHAAYVAIEIQKQLAYAALLRRRGLNDLSQEVYHKCLKQAKASGFPEHELAALVGLRNIAVSHSPTEVKAFGLKISESLRAFETDLVASEVFDTFQSYLLEAGGAYESAAEYLDNNISKVEEALSNAYSPRGHYYHLILLISKHQAKREVDKAREALQELIDLLEGNRGIASKDRLASSYLRLAALDLQAHQFEDGYRSARLAVDTFPPKKNNVVNASTYLVFACLYRHQYEEAKQVFKSLDFFRERQRGGGSLELITYLESCMEYLMGNYRQAYDLIGDVQRVFSDKSGWNISLRIYEIMLLIDRNLQDLSSPKIETLRKHMAKYHPAPRQEAMFRFLTLLERNSFRFDAFTPEMEQILTALTEELEWSAVSPEVVRFDTWIRSHRLQIAFSILFAQDIEKINAAKSKVIPS